MFPRRIVAAVLAFSLPLALPHLGKAQDGDQFLDGIGETALIARYMLNGDLRDWSRNALHASAVGDGHAFVQDETFGKVLSLPGGADGAYVRAPISAIADAVSFSVTGWVKVDSQDAGQQFFDVGSSGQHHLGLIPMGAKRQDGCYITIGSGRSHADRGPSGRRVRPGRWVHLAAVLDAADKTLSLYTDGTRVGRVEGFKDSLASLLGGDRDSTELQVYLGRSVAGGGPRLGGRLFDVRFYRSALSDKQVAVIHHNATSEDKITESTDAPDGASKGEDAEAAHAHYPGLTGVPDVQVETSVASLPRLPYEIPGIYQDGEPGPNVRVIWPSPEDNRTVAEPGRYVITGKVPGTPYQVKATVLVTQAPAAGATPDRLLRPFPLGQVLLEPDEQGNPTPFMKHRDKFFAGLANTDPDRFLYVFRDAFGQPQPSGVRPLGVWDSQTTRLRGHATGHYLTALAQAYASTSYDPALQATFAKKMRYMINTLHELSRLSGKPATEGGPATAAPADVPPGPGKSGYDSDLSRQGIRTDYWNWGEGFLSGYPPDQFIMLERGATYGGGNHQVWAPYYTLHKILAGLVDCYEVGGDPKALEVARGMGLWVYERLEKLPPKTRIAMWNSYIAGEYGGMNEIMARLYRTTGDDRFLESAKLFDNTRFFFGDAQRRHGLAKNVDTIRGRHANQHIPQILGALETYRVSHEAPYYDVAQNFWRICSHSYMYSIGGVAGARNPNNAECFTAEPDTLFRNGLSQGGQNETCATYNLLKLGRQLFLYDQEARYMDYYERAIYNHILASVDEDNPGNTYHVPLNPGARKSFGNARMNGFTCCNGTAIESGTKLQDSIYFKRADDTALYVNLFVPSTLDWQSRQVKLTQSTRFPYADTTTLTLQGDGRFSLFVRVPHWARQGVDVRINGEPQPADAAPGSYLQLRRTWQDGDQIRLRAPMSFHLLPLMDRPDIASIFYGPVLLAAEESGARRTWRTVALDTQALEDSISGDPGALRFQIQDTKLKPFFDFYDGFHSTYLKIEPTTGE